MKKNTQIEARPAALNELIAYQAGTIVSREILKQKTGSVTLFAFDAGQELSEHTAPFDALVQVLDGEAHVTVAGKRHCLSAGQLILMPAGQPHALQAEWQFKMLLTMIRAQTPEITLQTPVMELLLQWPEVRPVLAQAGLSGLIDPDHWPAPAITIEIAARRHQLDADALLAAVQTVLAGKPPSRAVTDADRQRAAALQHECHCGGH
jgi:quercetin dioxygenase-like cupin family protein